MTTHGNQIDPLLTMHVIDRAVDALTKNPRNARTHTQNQIRQIARSIETFGFTNPIIIDDRGNILAGHGRLAAAKSMGLESVPTISLSHMSEEMKRAYVIADNKLAENAGWDPEILAAEFEYLLEIETDFDVSITGFEFAEVDLVLEEATPDEADEIDQLPDINADRSVITRQGDLWRLGKHRLLCGDALSEADGAKLMQGRLAAMVFTDPPYNVPVAGHVSGLGRAQHSEFAMASGEMTGDDFQVFLERAFDRLAMHSDDGSIHFVCMDWRHMAEIVAAGQSVYSELKNVCVWDKGHGGMGSLYRSQHELVFVFKSGKRRHRNNVDLGRFGRTRTNVWRYPGMSSFGASRDETLAMHPTVKPVAMVADAMLDCSKRKDIVLDPFCGSGTTILAAEKTGRTACAIELEPKYVDTAIERWEKLTGEMALLDGTDWTFDDIGHERNDGDCLRSETA